MNKKIKNFLLLTFASLSAMHIYNRFTTSNATSKNLLSDANGSYYNWKLGKVFYTKRGTGSPILLIHDLTPTSSSFEFCKIMQGLEENHTVYTLDLLGCGRSDKPALSYTNYMYVQLISSFVKDVIGEKTDVIASGFSASFVIMSNHMDSDLFNKITCINPPATSSLKLTTSTFAKFKKDIMELPIIGTFIYNLRFTPNKIDEAFRSVYYEKPQLILSRIEDVFYESAHLSDGNGRFLLASYFGNYMNLDIEHAIKSLDKPLHIICSEELAYKTVMIDEYEELNDLIQVTKLSACRLYPHLECPDKILKSIN